MEGLAAETRATVDEFADAISELEEANQLEKIVADDLWPLPKYSEILFIK